MSENSDSIILAEKDIEFLIQTIQSYILELRQKRLASDNQNTLIILASTIFSLWLILFATFIINQKNIFHNSIIVQVSVASIFLCLLYGYSSYVLRNLRNIRRAKNDLKLSEIRLMRLTKRASQILDRGNLTFTQKIIFESLISDAELTINND